ncbi:MAG: nucleotide exchange factor GrpE [Roseburia sp.]|nr:nucleotide exchange factor GrpE [Roseburia sp.]MCM1556863.1 nucleotide exchange factor GrpE [Anaeroplasma bactoclasticum]
MAEEMKEEVKVEDDKIQEEEKPIETEESKEEVKTKKEKKDKYKEQVAKLEAELKEQHNEYLKVFAEMENTKRRLKEEAIKDRKYASQHVIGELITPIDMLCKIVASPAPSKEIANYLIGFQMITNQLMDILKAEGLTEIDALQKEFDPNLMQAVSTENVEDAPDNIVLKVMQSGYMYKDRILRPAMVVVNKKEQKENKEEE